MPSQLFVPYLLGSTHRPIPYQYLNIVKRLDKSEFNVTFFTEIEDGILNTEGVNEIYINGSWTYRKWARLLRSSIRKYDLVHTGGGPKLRYIISRILRFRNPVISHIHTLHVDIKPTGRFYTEYKRKSMELADVVTAVSQSTAKSANRNFGLDPIVIYNGIDESFYHPSRDSPEILDKLDASTPVFLFVGKLEPRKHPMDVLEVANNVQNATFVIRGSEGSLTAAVKKKAANLDNVSMVDRLSMHDLAGLYANVSGLMLPSEQEGCPTVVLEAMASGTPVVGYDATSLPELIEHDVTGYLFDQDDVDGLTEGVRSLTDVQTANRLGKNARAYVTEHHSFDVIVEQYEELYRKSIT